MHTSERVYKFLSCFMALMVLSFGIACFGPGPGGGDGDGDSGGAAPASPESCEDAYGVTDLTGTDGTASLTDPVTGQIFDVTVSDDSDNPLDLIKVLLFSNGTDYFILAFDAGGYYGLDSSGGTLVAVSEDGFLSPRHAYAQEPITVSLALDPVPAGTKLLRFSGTPPNLLSRRWCGIGSYTETCWAAEQMADTLGVALFFMPETNEIWLALAQAISEDFVENGIASSYTGGRTFYTFNIDAFPSIVFRGDACDPSGVSADDIRITLVWNNNADIDLHVTDPDGYEIYWADRISTSGGELDFDAMCGSFPEGSRGGPEHVTWGPGEAIAGEYTVEVNYWGECYNEGETRFSVTIYVTGTKIFEVTDAIITPADTGEDKLLVHEFTY